MRAWILGSVGCVVVAGGMVACGAADDGGDFAPAPGGSLDGGGTGDGGVFIPPDSGMGGAGPGEPLPPEEEDLSTFRAPVATGRFLWSANPESGRVAMIDGQSLAVRVFSAGLFPTHLAAAVGNDQSRALVLNVGSSDASIFTLTGDMVTEEKVDTHVGANAWTVSDSGSWAVAWSRSESGQVLDPTESFQEITVIDLTANPLEAERLTVGYRPSLVHIDDADQKLSVVSDEGITLIDLSPTPTIRDWIQLGSGAGRDVSITEEGRHALVRRQGQSTIEIIDLTDPSSTFEVTLGGAITDLDLAESGRAVAVVREKSELSTFLVDEITVDPTAHDTVHVPGEVFGSAALAPGGNTAALYTNAVESDRVTVVQLVPGTEYLDYRTVSTKSPVQAVSTSPDGRHAIALGKDADVARSFSVLSLEEARFPRIVGTDAVVHQVALGNDSAIVTTSSSDTHEAHLVQLPELNVRSTRLASAPVAAGILTTEDLGYVAQRHTEGRITFFDFDTAKARTLTGFELAAEVVSE